MIKTTIILAFAISLTSCVNTSSLKNTRIDFNNPDKVKNQIVFTHDTYKKQTTFQTPNLGTEFDQLFIRGSLNDDSPSINFQIYIADYYYGDWRFYHSAYDSLGKKLKTTQISRDIISCTSRLYGCSHKEHVGILTSYSYLKNATTSGINLKVYGKAGDATFYIPGGYIVGLLSAIDEYPARLKEEMLSYKSAMEALESIDKHESNDYKTIKELYDSTKERIDIMKK